MIKREFRREYEEEGGGGRRGIRELQNISSVLITNCQTLSLQSFPVIIKIISSFIFVNSAPELWYPPYLNSSTVKSSHICQLDSLSGYHVMYVEKNVLSGKLDSLLTLGTMSEFLELLQVVEMVWCLFSFFNWSSTVKEEN